MLFWGDEILSQGVFPITYQTHVGNGQNQAQNQAQVKTYSELPPLHKPHTHHRHTPPPHTTTHHHTPTHHHTQTTTTTTNGQNQGPSQEYPAERDSAFDGLPAVCVPDDLCMHMRQFMRNQRATKRFKAIHTICTEAPSLSETPNAGRVITRVSITTSIRTPHPKTSVKSDTAQ